MGLVSTLMFIRNTRSWDTLPPGWPRKGCWNEGLAQVDCWFEIGSVRGLHNYRRLTPCPVFL